MSTTPGSLQALIAHPLTLEQILQFQVNNRISAVIPIRLDEISTLTPEELSDHLSLKLVDSDLLTDVQYERAGIQDEETVLLHVSGETTLLLETLELLTTYAEDEEEFE
ncbi:hypothetical protein [Saccharibacillus qingshengii]|uniref:hypothetical protein n=1 Tax=Saccharibacillus qingshengii TaxID=1763540 RepID=UPI001552BC74|nr:hypothetical protein [Saccharibacillus qingshengii]